MNAVDVEGLQKAIPVGFLGRPQVILRNMSFAVEEGAAVAFVGPNGAGKSSTLRHIIGGSRPTAGRVRVFGQDPTVPAARASFGYLPDTPALPPHLTASETLALHASLAGVPYDAGLLEQVGLGKAGKARVRTFSKGMQTRLGLALALIGAPRLLVLDEPMSGLDPVGRHEVREIIQRQHAAGKSVLFSTHVLADVEALCDRVVVIHHGEVLFAGTLADAIGTNSTRRALLVPGTTPEEKLRAHGTVERQGDQLALIVDAADPFAVVATLRQAGVEVSEVRRVLPRLEERVLQLLQERSAA